MWFKGKKGISQCLGDSLASEGLSDYNALVSEDCPYPCLSPVAQGVGKAVVQHEVVQNDVGCAVLATCEDKVRQDEVGSPLPLCILPP